MKRTIKTIGTIAIIAVIAIGSFCLGTTQAKTITDIQTVTEIKEVEKVVEVVPDGYIKLDECIPLEDIASHFIDSDDYICFELKDVGYQLDDSSNRSYTDIMNVLEDMTADFYNNFVDMQKITDFTATANGLQIYFDDGTGYYWER